MTKRCFIALTLPQEARWEIEALISDLGKINQDKNIKFVDGKQVHITLHFLGDLETDQVEQVKSVLSDDIKDFPAGEVITGQIGAFPDLKQPQTIYLSCQEVGGNPLLKMQGTISEELRHLGFEIDNRKWAPHITLARIKGPCHFKTDFIELSELSIPITEVALMESELNSDGPTHRVIQGYKLSN